MSIYMWLLILQVTDFTRKVASRRWSGSTIPEEDEETSSIPPATNKIKPVKGNYNIISCFRNTEPER